MKTVAMSSSEALSSSKHFSLPLHIMPSLGVFVICAMLEGRTYISKLLMIEGGVVFINGSEGAIECKHHPI